MELVSACGAEWGSWGGFGGRAWSWCPPVGQNGGLGRGLGGLWGRIGVLVGVKGENVEVVSACGSEWGSWGLFGEVLGVLRGL